MNLSPKWTDCKLLQFQQTVPPYCNVSLKRFLVTIESWVFNADDSGNDVENCDKSQGIYFDNEGETSLYSGMWKDVFCV